VSKQRRYYTWNPGTGMAWGQDKLDLHVTPEREADQDRAHIVNVARDDIPRLIADLQRVHASMLDDDHWHSSVRRPASEAADRIGSAIVETMRNGPPAPHCRAHLEFRSDCDRCLSEQALHYI
jgi:hypothetical protein